jgi:hypothetical protein
MVMVAVMVAVMVIVTVPAIFHSVSVISRKETRGPRF